MTADLDATFSALSDPTRRAILSRLAMGEATVMELAEQAIYSTFAMPTLVCPEAWRRIDCGQRERKQRSWKADHDGAEGAGCRANDDSRH